MLCSEIQALVFTNYKDLARSSFVLARVRVGQERTARACLSHLLEAITFRDREDDPTETALNIAFTHAGLAALGVPDEILRGFPLEYTQGMHHEDRARALGDVDEAGPDTWAWGSDNVVHVMFMIYGKGAEEIDAARADLLHDTESAFEICYEKRGRQLGDDREHFGFKDGISQPTLVSGDLADPNDVPFGEIVLGEPNLYGKEILDPLAGSDADPNGILEGSFGRNGTYLVARELKQDVHAFWDFLDQRSRSADGEVDTAARELLGAKVVGRMKDGTPLAELAKPGDPNAFDFSDDKQGYRCPIGAHIRRANPRASLEPTPEDSLATVRARRILRRGRSYGEPNWTPLTTPDAKPVDRGLVFVCLNANIRRQFEFVQQAWVNNVKFAGLYDERDPLTGSPPTSFTIPRVPVRRHVSDIPAFTRMRGGNYFFLPSRRALRYLAQLA